MCLFLACLCPKEYLHLVRGDGQTVYDVAFRPGYADRILHSVTFEGSRREALIILEGYLDFVSIVFCKISLCFHKGSQRKQNVFLFLCV